MRNAFNSKNIGTTLVILIVVVVVFFLLLFCLAKFCLPSAEENGELADGDLEYKNKLAYDDEMSSERQNENENQSLVKQNSNRGIGKKVKVNKVQDEISAKRREQMDIDIGNEQVAMNEFRQKMSSIGKRTPEAFYRMCDYNYSKEVSTGDFKNELNKLELGLS